MKIISVISFCGSMFICYYLYEQNNKKNFLNIEKKYLKKYDKSIDTTPPEQKIIFLKSNETIEIYKNHTFPDSWKLKYYHNQLFVKEIDVTPNDNNTQDNISRILSLKNNKVITKLINIETGGIYGYYDIGISKIIRDKFNLQDYIFSGVSAGSWNSLFMVYKHDDYENIIEHILNEDFINFGSIKNLQLMLKEKILNNYKTEDFELDKLFISVCVYENFIPNNYIYTDFISLEDAINCCIASSNIPLLTGDFFCRYRNQISFDGGFLSNQHLAFIKPIFTIKNSIWGRKKFLSLFGGININLKNLYIEGQTDTLENIDYLQSILSSESIKKNIV